MHIPGHTLGAVAYFVDDGGERAVFTGDTLFCAGCGRLFEGTPAQMHASLSRARARCPATRASTAATSTPTSNLRFAAHVEPSNADVRARARARDGAARAGRADGRDDARRGAATNPFLRVESPEIRATLGIARDADDVDAFAAIRAAKDSFR